jgi:hypothetical protein
MNIILIMMLFLESRTWGIECGIKPFPPFGCSYEDAVCICNQTACNWVYICQR